MEWLGGWLKQLIFVVMLAAFVDLLLPSRAMQRYAKTVIGLFMLLVLLSPVFELFRKGWDADKLIAEAENLQQGKSMLAAAGETGSPKAEGKGAASLDQILKQSEQIKGRGALQAKQLAETRIGEEMREGLQKNAGLAASVNVALTLDDKGNPAVQRVQVTLSDRKERPDAGNRPGGSKANDQASGGSSIGQVKPVVIDIPPIKSETGGMEASGSSPASESDSRVRQAISYIGREWQVPEDRITVNLNEPASRNNPSGR